jgi:hypothetical protein
MLGHYPPVCYPAHGWVSQSTRVVQIRLGENLYPAMEYQFRRSLRDGETAMAVTNFFILPGAGLPTAPDLSALNEASQSLALASLGAAQVQIVMDPSIDEKRREQIVDAFIGALEPVIRAVSQEAPIAP